MAIEEGKAAPAFKLKDQNGKTVSLADFKGKQNVVVYFYPKDDTPGCTKEACGFRDLNKQLARRDTVVLGISADNEASHQKFIGKFKLPFTLLSDPNQAVMLVPTDGFKRHSAELRGKPGNRHETSDPERASTNLLERDLLMTAHVRETAVSHGLRLIEVDGSEGVEAIADLVAAHFGL